MGLFAGIGLALCQSIGIILMKPALESTDPIVVSYLRVIVAAVIMFGSLFFLIDCLVFLIPFFLWAGVILPP